MPLQKTSSTANVTNAYVSSVMPNTYPFSDTLGAHRKLIRFLGMGVRAALAAGTLHQMNLICNPVVAAPVPDAGPTSARK
jgi:hypothetical protein